MVRSVLTDALSLSEPDDARPSLLRLEPIAERVRPHLLARDDLVPVHEAFGPVLGSVGLRRGSTVVIGSRSSPGAIACALGLLVDATAAGMWCAVVDLPTLGLVAATELGVDLDRLVLVPSSHARPLRVVAALLDGCDVVVVGQTARTAAGEARRLAARARERRSVLVVCCPATSAESSWPEAPDVAVEVTGSSFSRVTLGFGHLTGRLVELAATRRRVSPRFAQTRLWLPSPNGRIETERSGLLEQPDAVVGDP